MCVLLWLIEKHKLTLTVGIRQNLKKAVYRWENIDQVINIGRVFSKEMTKLLVGGVYSSALWMVM